MGSDLPEVAIAVIGCGTVGGATAEILLRDREMLREKSGLSLKLKYIVDRNFTYAEQLKLDNTLYEQEFRTVLEDPDVQVVVELVGGTDKSEEIIRQALQAGKNVVTANKAVLAYHGAELLGLAREHGVVLAFEASCGGGIPILRALYDGLLANEIEAIYGIVNGTSNFILTEMIENGESYEEALWAAQSKGLAEADPTLDVDGSDSAHKIAIMAALAFGVRIDFDQIPVAGINKLQRDDVLYGAKLGYVAKLLAIATRESSGISIRVRPAFISKDHPLAWVSGPFNAISVYGNITGHTMYYGRGAGGSPTASAVVADIASIGRGSLPETFRSYSYWPDLNQETSLCAVEETSNRYYVRVLIDDRPGTLAGIAEIFGKHGFSIASVLQDELGEHLTDDDSKVRASVVITLHRALERDVRAAIEEINGLDSTGAECSLITIIDEHSERLS